MVQREFLAGKGSCGRTLGGKRAHGKFQELKKLRTYSVLRKMGFNMRRCWKGKQGPDSEGLTGHVPLGLYPKNNEKPSKSLKWKLMMKCLFQKG